MHFTPAYEKHAATSRISKMVRQSGSAAAFGTDGTQMDFWMV